MANLHQLFKGRVSTACLDALEDSGFCRFRRWNVDWPLSEEFHAWVGLNVALDGEYVEVNPFVGVHAVRIMRLYTELEGRKYDRSTATFAIHLGEIAPNEPSFRLGPETDIGAEARRLARLYRSVGLDYAKKIAKYDALLPLISARVPMLGGYPERVACCLYLMGRRSEAVEFVQSFNENEPEYLSSFAEPFLKMVAREHG